MVPFGDIILPFVGVLAVILLLIAAKLFFMNGLSASSGLAAAQPVLPVPSVTETSLEDYPMPDVPVSKPLAAAEKTSGGNVAAKDAGGDSSGAKGSAELLAVEVTATPVETESYLEADGIIYPDPDDRAPKPAPAQPKQQAPQTPQKPQKTKGQPKSTSQPAQKAAASQQPWRVQVGAYGSKAAAGDIVKKLAKHGYSATVFSGPKYHKVWVQAGNTKAAAEKTASRLKSLGYPGSYVVPPSSK
jgi:cell division septation protein DedD